MVTIIYANNLQNKNDRGIIIYIKDDLEVCKYDMKIDYDEALCLKIKINKSENMLLGCVYRSPIYISDI